VDQQQRRPLAPGDRVQAHLTDVDIPAGELFLNPRGRCGAPETEPGPFGAGGRVEAAAGCISPLPSEAAAAAAGRLDDGSQGAKTVATKDEALDLVAEKRLR
jgi:hypothetical protein